MCVLYECVFVHTVCAHGHTVCVCACCVCAFIHTACVYPSALRITYGRLLCFNWDTTTHAAVLSLSPPGLLCIKTYLVPTQRLWKSSCKYQQIACFNMVGRLPLNLEINTCMYNVLRALCLVIVEHMELGFSATECRGRVLSWTRASVGCTPSKQRINLLQPLLTETLPRHIAKTSKHRVNFQLPPETCLMSGALCNFIRSWFLTTSACQPRFQLNAAAVKSGPKTGGLKKKSEKDKK